MPDRILRDELWQSDRFLDLPTDMARLAFLRFISLADDFGNMEGGPRRIFRMLQACTQLKSEDAASGVIDSLMAADLLRRYVVEGRELFHIPRFKSHKQYLSRRYPPSPWCDQNAPLGKAKRLENQALGENVVTTKLLHSSHVAGGVGVGVGDRVREKTTQVAAIAKKSEPLPAFNGANLEAIPDRALVEIAVDFALPAPWGEDAERLGWKGAQVLREAEKFRQYWTAGRGKGTRRSIRGWRSAWSTWLSKAEARA